MVAFRLEFSDSEMVEFFKGHGLLIIDVVFKKHIPVYHNREEVEEIATKCVVNPIDNKTIPVSIAFERVLLTAKKHLLFDNITKVDVLESLR